MTHGDVLAYWLQISRCVGIGVVNSPIHSPELGVRLLLARGLHHGGLLLGYSVPAVDHLVYYLLLSCLSISLVLLADGSSISRILPQREEVCLGIIPVVRLNLVRMDSSHRLSVLMLWR